MTQTQKILSSAVKEVVEDAMTQKKIDAEEYEQIIVFELGNEQYGVEITDLKEIIKVQEITPIPNSPDYIKGIFNLRGAITVVIDLEKHLHLKKSEEHGDKQHIMISEVDGVSFGIEIDKVLEVMRIQKSKIRKAPASLATKIQEAYINGVAVIGETDDTSRIIIILNLPALLRDKQVYQLGDDVNREAHNLEKTSARINNPQ